MTNHIVEVTLILAVVCLILKLIIRRGRSLNLPPGPSGLPIIGNVLDLPRSHEWLTFANWGERWGPILSVKIFGKPIIILNSISDAVALLENRSSLYSDRPTLVMAGELMGWNRALQLIPYGSRFRALRKLLGQSIGTRNHVRRFHDLIEEEAHRFIHRILVEPDSVLTHVRRSVRAMMLEIISGYTVTEGYDPIANVIEAALPEFPESSAPAAYLVDIFPILQHIPDWLPGAGFKRGSKKWRKDVSEMAGVPFQYVEEQLRAGTATPSFTSCLLENETLSDDEKYNIKWAAASMLSGGSDTTVSSIQSFFLAMTVYPEIQRKAQAEIDEVIGSDRLPTLADRDRLPYVEALVKEIYRFNPVGPLGLPHRSIKDDIYQGYLIPKGAMVIANLWNMLHDPNIYSDPMEFNPSRFLRSLDAMPEKDPKEICFGFGRRVCPGSHLADASIFISCAMTLAAFNIAKSVINGKLVAPIVEYTSGAISQPKPFLCSITLRSTKAEELIYMLASGVDGPQE